MLTVFAAVEPEIPIEEELIVQEIAEQVKQEEAEATRYGIDVNEWKELIGDFCYDAVEIAFQS